MFRLSSLVLVFAACLIQPVQAELRQYCDTVYDLPEGWTLYRGGEGYQRLGTRSRDDCERCSLYITESMTPKAALAVLKKGNLGQFLDEDDPEPRTLGDIKTLGSRQPVLTLGSWMVGKDIVFLVSVENGKRATLIGFRGAGGTPEALKASGDAFQAAIAHLVEHLAYIPDGAEPVMPPPEPGPLEGIYWGSIGRWTPGMDGMLSMDIQSRVMVFWDNGLFYDGEPDEGLALPRASAFDCPNEASGEWGTYRVDGDEVTITYLKGETETLELSDGSLYDGDRQMFRADPVADDTRIEGVIAHFSYSAFNPNIVVGGVASSAFVAYRDDGTYATESTSSVTATMNGPDAETIGGLADSNGSKGGGTYAIANSTVIMTPDDGSPPISRLIYRLGDDIYIGTDPLKVD